MQPGPLLELMTQQVAQQCDEIIAAAKAEAASIQRAAEDRATAYRAAALQQTDSELHAQATRSRERAEAESHMVVMTTKDTVTVEVMDDVQRRLRAVAEGPEFPQVLEALLGELLDGAPQEVIVLAPPKQVDHVRQWLQAHGRGSTTVQGIASLRDGVAIQDKDHKWRVTNSLSSRLRRQEGALRKNAVSRLFGAEG